MLLRFAFLTIFALPALIRGGQFPIADGVVGGVPSPDAHDFKTPKGAFDDASAPAPTPTPGKLRVVEKSGICGEGHLVYDPPRVILTASTETTHGVYQASGYGDIASDKSIWFVLHLDGSLCF
jgi:hypothetical protein